MIETIKIKIGDKEIELTIEQAKELKAELDSMFGNTYIPYYPPLNPEPTPFYYEMPPITCDGTWTDRQVPVTYTMLVSR